MAESLQSRTGASPGDTIRDAASLPPGIDLDDGLSDDDAVALALWNNGAFQADLAALGYARADLAQAGLLPNPVLSFLFPLGPKQLELTASMGISWIWQRPYRVEAAQLDAERIAERLVENGLDLARRVRVAHSRLALSERRVELAKRAAETWQEIAHLAEARLEAGDASRLEALAVRTDARIAELEADRVVRERDAAEAEVRLLTGLEHPRIPASGRHAGTSLGADLNGPPSLEIGRFGRDGSERGASGPSEARSAVVLEYRGAPLKLVVSPLPARAESLETLTQRALGSRPELRAAELAIEAAGERAGLARASIFDLIGILDLNGSGLEGLEIGPGLSLPIPLFDQGQAARTRAAAELEESTWRYIEVRRSIVRDVVRAHASLDRALAAATVWPTEVIAPLEENVRLVRTAYTEGGASYLAVLEATRRVIDARARGAELEAEARESAAELARAVGRKAE